MDAKAAHLGSTTSASPRHLSWALSSLLLLSAGLGLAAAFASWSWHQVRTELSTQVRLTNSLAADASRYRVLSVTEDLPELARQIESAPDDAVRGHILQNYVRYHTRVPALALFDPAGQPLATALQVPTMTLPPLRAQVAEALGHVGADGLWVGRTIMIPQATQRWVPLFLCHKNSLGKNNYVLAAFLRVNDIANDWKHLELPKGSAIGLLRVDGIQIARLPAANPEKLYGTPMKGPLMQAYRAHPGNAGGSYAGRTQSDDQVRLGWYEKLGGLPLLAYLSLPQRVLWSQWWVVAGPALLLLLAFALLAAAIPLLLHLLRARQEHDLYRQARVHPLTQLPNRLAAQEWIEKHAAGQQPFWLMLLDIDHFRDLNNGLGPQRVDELLQETAQRLNTLADAEHAFLAHLGADEFLIGLPRQLDQSLALGIARRAQEGLYQPIASAGYRLALTACVGLTRYPQDGLDVTALLQAAQGAQQLAKSSGPGSVRFFDATVTKKSSERIAFREAVEHALKNDEFQLHYQPVMNLADGSVHHVEALIRWRHPKRGLLAPGEFLPLAEETGWISAISEWVVGEAASTLGRWREHSLRLPIAVNLDADFFASPRLTTLLYSLIRRHQLQPGMLQIEITERTIMLESVQEAATVSVLRDLGIEVSIDGCGTGYSSIAYLRHLPVDASKIDRSFISDLENDGRLVQTIVSMAGVFGARVVAEGVETDRQHQTLLSLGVDMGQGYWYSRPMEESALLEWLRHQPAAAAPPIQSSH